MGSAFWGLMNNERQLFWGAGNRIAFPWERTGWVHLYSVSESGGDPVELTPGEFEVEHVASSPDGRELVFSSNQADVDRRHLWRSDGQPPDSPGPGAAGDRRRRICLACLTAPKLSGWSSGSAKGSGL